MKSNNNIILNWKKSCDLLIDEKSVTELSDEYEKLKYKIRLIIINNVLPDNKNLVSELLENFERVKYPFDFWCDSLKDKNYNKLLFIRGNNSSYIIETPCVGNISPVSNCVIVDIYCYNFEKINKHRFIKEKIDKLLNDIR